MDSFANRKHSHSESVTTSADTLLESIDFLSVTYLCLSCCEDRCGATLYQTSGHAIQLIPEMADNDLDSVVSLLIQTEPNHVILSSKSDPKLIQLLKNCANHSDTDPMVSEDDNSSDFVANNSILGSTDLSAKQRSIQTSEQLANETHSSRMDSSCELWPMEAKFRLHIVSYNLFNYENARTRILSIDVSTEDMDLSNEMQKFLYISSLIEFSDNNTFRSFGALLRFLDKNCVEMQTQSNRTSIEISGISRIYLQQLVAIERNSYDSLQVFQQEWHPSVAKQGSAQKEGLSLYGLFNCCVSKIGANYLRKLFLLPTQEIDIIMDRLNAIEFFVQPNNADLRLNLCQHLKHIKNVGALFGRIMSSTFTTIDLKNIYNNLINALRIRDIIVRQNTSLQVFEQIRHSFTEDMDGLAHIINKVIDFDKSSKGQTFEINAGIDSDLDNAKYVFTRLPQLLAQVAEEEVRQFGSILADCNCVYIPQIGFLTSVRLTDADQTDFTELGFEFVISASDRVYYRTVRTKQIDERFGDIQSEINDRQIQIISRLQELVINKKHLFVSITKSCAKLDALIAMSQTAVNYRYNKPNITTDGVIEIIDGRHPLIELVSQTFVPNDYQSGGQYRKVKLISGPNACGKSVYLKQICLIVYMAHIGSFVPALTANISIIDRMFTRIHTPESISTRLSTFMLDLSQMSNATQNATKRSLVVVDEFGKGTQSIDGLALMTAFIDHWLTGSTPHLMVSTHFLSLPSVLNKSDSYDCQTFAFTRDDRQLTYLFKLIAGPFNQSIASHIAYLAAIPLEVIERGLYLCELMATNRPIDGLESQELNRNYEKCERIGSKFLELNVQSDEQIQQFFKTYFAQSLRTQESVNNNANNDSNNE